MQEIGAFSNIGVGRDGLSSDHWQTMSRTLGLFENLRSTYQDWYGVDYLVGQEMMIDAPCTLDMFMQNNLSLAVDCEAAAGIVVAYMRSCSRNGTSGI